MVDVSEKNFEETITDCLLAGGQDAPAASGNAVQETAAFPG